MNKLNPDIASDVSVLKDNTGRSQPIDHFGNRGLEAAQVQKMPVNEKAPLRTDKFSNGCELYTHSCHSPPQTMRHFNY